MFLIFCLQCEIAHIDRATITSVLFSMKREGTSDQHLPEQSYNGQEGKILTFKKIAHFLS